MFYRRKVVLGILEIFGGTLAKINLQKIIFLISNQQSKPTYEFIPYKFGAFSYSLSADLTAMVKHGFINEDETQFTKKDRASYLSSLNDFDRQLINQTCILYKGKSADELMKLTYTHFPYYAINSVAAGRLLTSEQLKKVAAARFSSDEIQLFTLGYEGVSVEAYLNKLICNDIKVLVDVRKNPLSQKYGFSKSLLIKHCANLNIEYVHIGELGIDGEERRTLNDQFDYDALFERYKNTTLKNTPNYQIQILILLKEKRRVALTCFEADICQCHRKHLSEAITQLPGWHFSLKHI